ncbi:hypothetical protein JHK82_050772 [Glycine max]|nr:hypothetical protein JHK82_050772 [Glycine max]
MGIAKAVVDQLGQLVKNLFDVYQKPVELSWDEAKFGLPNSKNGIPWMVYTTGKEVNLEHFIKSPTNIVVLEGECLDAGGDGGELESFLNALLASISETEKQTEVVATVSTWKQTVENNLEEQRYDLLWVFNEAVSSRIIKNKCEATLAVSGQLSRR